MLKAFATGMSFIINLHLVFLIDIKTFDATVPMFGGRNANKPGYQQGANSRNPSQSFISLQNESIFLPCYVRFHHLNTISDKMYFDLSAERCDNHIWNLVDPFVQKFI